MRIKTIPSLVSEIRTIDPSSAVGESFLMHLTVSKQLSHSYHGNRLVVDADAIVPTLNHLLGFEGNGNLPHIRTIREAAAELKQIHPQMGVGEKLIRSAVKDGRIASICIGNRKYIALESFDEPYCRRIFAVASTMVSRVEVVRKDVMEQMAQTIASNPFIPTIKRVRKAR